MADNKKTSKTSSNATEINADKELIVAVTQTILETAQERIANGVDASIAQAQAEEQINAVMAVVDPAPEQIAEAEAKAKAEAEAKEAQEKINAMPQDLEVLKTAYTALTNRVGAVTALEAKHAEFERTAKTLNLQGEQLTNFRIMLGIGESLEADIAKLDIAPYLVDHLDAIKTDPSIAVWRDHVVAIVQAEDLIKQVNEVRAMLGQPTIFLAFTSAIASTTGRARTVRGDNGSEAHDNASAKFMRPGVVHLKFDSFNITWRADLNEHTLSVDGNEGVKLVTKQGDVGLASTWRKFLNEKLMRPNTNDSLPERLTRNGYTKDGVYMYTAPTSETTAIKQPEQQATV